MQKTWLSKFKKVKLGEIRIKSKEQLSKPEMRELFIFGKSLSPKGRYIPGTRIYNWEPVEQSLFTHGYRPHAHRHGHIEIFQTGKIVDGNHRACILKEKYGEEYEVEVLRHIRCIYYARFFFALTLMLFFLSISEFYRLIKSAIKAFKNKRN